MLLLIALCALTTIASALPRPAKRCDALLENIPWTIRNLTAFEPAEGCPDSGYISFHFCDVNPGLELETWCTRTVAAGSNESVIDPGTYYSCDGNEVRFIYSGDELQVERAYSDDW